MSEAAFSVKVQKWLRAHGCWVVKYHASAYTPKGVPDLIVCCAGQFIGLELKAGTSLSDWQCWQGDRIKEAGGLWYKLEPADFPDKLVKILKKAQQNGR